MVRNEFKKFHISLKDKHLLDIYSNTANYLELGTINFDVIARIVNYEMVNFNDVSYLPIQNSGIGKSNIKNDKLKAYVPYIFFQNINQKNRPFQVFITHGLLKLKDHKNKEMFSPLLLIPVNIFFEGGKIYFQQISDPIENTVLLDYLAKEKKINIPISEKLDNLYNIERYFTNFSKHEGLKFIFENFITYASVIGQEAIINQNKFSLNKFQEAYLYENLYNSDNVIYYSKKHNINQRNALNQALEGKSFVITGRLGTGKSTVLRDIAINAISEGNKVLYVSNMQETLNNLYEFFENKGIHHYITNLTNSFASIHSGELVLPHSERLHSATNFDELLKNYKYISDYQKAMTGRILDYRYIDIINELITLVGESKTILDIDSLEHIYKAEYLEILAAIKNIGETLKEFNDFKNSVWKEIPIINDIKYPNQVITLIHKVTNGFLELNEKKETLEAVYGFKEINNYAYLKNVLHNFRGLNINEVPKSWYDKENYDQAKLEYTKLKTLIFTLQELEYDLDIRFDNLDKFDIRKEINTLYGDFFQKDDLGKINKIIKDRLKIVVQLNKALVQIDIFNKSYTKLKRILNYDFDLSNDVLGEIVKMAKILLETNINSKYVKAISDGKYQAVYLEATRILSNYLHYNTEKENLFDDLAIVRFGTIDETVTVFEKYKNGEKVKRYQNRIIEKLKLEDEATFNKIYDCINRFNELTDLIKIEDQKFIDLLDYHPDQIYIDDFVKVYEFIESIDNLTVKSKILKFLKKSKEIDESKNKNYHRIFDYFQKAYYKINSFYEAFLEYEFMDIKNEFSDKINDLQKINNYIQNSFYSNDILYSLKKLNTSEYVTAEDYYYIYEAYNKIDDIKHELNTNKDFTYYFGNMYNKYNTDLSKISKLIQAFRLYSECFVNDEYVSSSLNSDNHSIISEVLNEASNTVDNLNEVFKLYFKIFKNSVSRFYYAEFKDNINYLKGLLNNKDLLIVYLKITDNLQVLAKYRLYKLIEYIVYLEDSNTLVNDFKYTYLSTVNEIYLKKYPFLKNYRSLEAALRIATSFEDELIEAIEERVFKKIKKRSSTRLSTLGVRNLDYDAYIRKTSSMKHLYLTNTQVLNNFLNIKDFDLVLIDDGHLFDANEYSYALQGKQVIIAGETQLQEAVANNLISRISLSKNIDFNYRYSPIPKNLKNFTQGLSAPIYKNYYDNHGIEVIAKEIYKYIVDLYKTDKDTVINLFISSLITQRNVYDNLANLLIDNGFTEDEILNIFTSKINIVDLKKAYLVDADYNILYLEDYYLYDEDYIVPNMIDNILLCKVKLVIYDNLEILNSNTNTNFLIELNKIVSNKNIFMPASVSYSISKLIDVLTENKIICYSYDLCTFLIRAKATLYGVSVYWDTTKTNYDVLNEFRDIHTLDNEKIKENIIVWAMELVDDFDEVVARILAEVNK
ncbi:MAG: DEAD/DEAH box helicase [Bacilli bacterium]